MLERFGWIALIAAATVPCGGTEVPFAPNIIIDDTFGDPRAAAIADLDGDGDRDLIAASRALDTLAWWENTAGDGSAWAEQTIEAGATVDLLGGVAAADLDRDGDVDVVAAVGAGDTIALWRNLSDGRLWSRTTVGGGFAGPSAVAVGDFDGDGDPDVVATFSGAGRIAWFANLDGTGTSWAPLTDEAFANAGAVAVADLDGDGDLDTLAATEGGASFAWWENDGTGGAFTAHALSVGLSDARDLVAGDLDGDGDPDIAGVAGGTDDQVLWWRNTDGAGSFSAAIEISAALDDPSSIRAEDLDRDGDLDLAVTASAGDQVAWLENTAGDASAWTLRPIDAGIDGADGLGIADLDGDGDPDVTALARDAGDLLWWPNATLHRSARFGAEHEIVGGFDFAGSVSAADLDGDGDLDVLATEGISANANRITWWENDRTPCAPSCAWPAHEVATMIGRPGAVVAADMDADGDLDVLGGPGIRWWENDGSPCTPACAWPEHAVDASFAGLASIVGADLDGDGDTDILGLAGLPTEEAAWWENDGSPCAPGCAWPKHSLGFVLNGSGEVAVGDLDGDGDRDVLLANLISNDIAWWQNDGSACGASCTWPKHFVETNFDNATSVDGADMDGDGDLDLAVTRFGFGGEVGWFENDRSPCTPDCSWPFHLVDSSFSGALSVVAADLDGDGDRDLVAAARFDDQIAWWENDGSPCTPACSWPERTLVSEFDNGSSAFVADLDRDGDLDVLGTAAFGDRVSWWQNRGGQFALPTDDAVAVPLVAPGAADTPLLRVDGVHRGRPGDGDAELATLELRFESDTGVPLTGPQLDAWLDRLALYADDGDGTFEPDSDDGPAFLALTPPFALSAGTLTAGLVDGDPSVQMAVGSPRTWWLAADIDAGAAAAMPDRIRVIHVTSASSTGEMTATDIPLVLEAQGDVGSQTIEINRPPMVAMPIADLAVEVGQTVAVDLAASFADPNDEPLAFSATGLPSSLTVSSSGLLSGLVASGDLAGSPYTVTVTAQDLAGLMAQDVFELTVTLPAEVILVDGFESGDLSAWSLVLP